MTAEETFNLAIRRAPIAWFENFGRIQDKAAKLVQPKANRMQSDLGQIYEWCREKDIPCRMIGLKGRQTGLSTGSTALMYTHQRNQTSKACLIGDEYEKTVKNLVDMFDRYAKNDTFPWGSEYNPANGKMTNGSELVTETANDPRAGASGTLQFLLGSEVAHWKETEVISAKKTLASILNCVPELGNTVVILESTPNGASGAFFDTYQGAVTFEEFKAGNRGNGYIKIFFAWWEASDYEVALDDSEVAAIKATLTQREREMIAKFNLRPGHIEFRRRTLASPKFGGDEDLFDQEYPSDEITCFLTSGRAKFNREALAKMMERAKLSTPEYGLLEGKFDGIIFRRTEKEEGWLWLWERPIDGCKYQVIADPAVGASQTGGKDPDSHSVTVLRSGYFDLRGSWVKTKVVARVFYGCKVDLDVLAEWIEYLTAFYGRCVFVPEANNSGIAIIEMLKNKIEVYRRKLWNFRESKETEALGWQTKDGAGRDGTRSICIGNLAAAIRDNEIDILDPNMVDELQNFIVADSGRAQAARGHHDDDVLNLAIGLTTMEGATTYRTPTRIRTLPRDLQALVNGRMSKGRSMYR